MMHLDIDLILTQVNCTFASLYYERSWRQMYFEVDKEPQKNNNKIIAAVPN